MTEQLARSAVTPADIARRPPLPAALAPRPTLYDRHRWEEALLAAPLEHHAARLLGWGLAHFAGTRGYLPPGTTDAERLSRPLRLSVKQVRMSLRQLQEAGLISRPDMRTWQPKELSRPITLTLPPAADGGRREEPPHTGGADA